MSSSEPLPTDFSERAAVVHERALASSIQFGDYAASSSNAGIIPSTVSAPRTTQLGEVVVTKFRNARNNTPISNAMECLVTLKRDSSVRLGPARLVNFLATELSIYYHNQLMATDVKQFSAALERTPAEPSVLRINKFDVPGWSLCQPEGCGVVAQIGPMVYMWLGVDGSKPPVEIFTKDLGSHVLAIVNSQP